MFERLVDKMGEDADWIVVPDIVGGGHESLRRSEEWLPRLEGIGRRRLLAVQDGITPADVSSMLGPELGVFVGGSTEWKWRTVAEWSRAAKDRGAYVHVGRVNTRSKILECVRIGADSFDGTSATRFAVTLPRLDASRRQTAFLLEDR